MLDKIKILFYKFLSLGRIRIRVIKILRLDYNQN